MNENKRKYMRAYYQHNRDILNERSKENYRNNREKRLERMKEYNKSYTPPKSWKPHTPEQIERVRNYQHEYYLRRKAARMAAQAEGNADAES